MSRLFLECWLDFIVFASQFNFAPSGSWETRFKLKLFLLRCRTNQSAALSAGSRKRWRQQSSKGLTGSTSCSGPSNLPPTSTERKWRENETATCLRKQMDFCVNGSVSCMGTACRKNNLLLLPRWSFRTRSFYTLLLLSVLVWMERTWKSRLSDYRYRFHLGACSDSAAVPCSRNSQLELRNTRCSRLFSPAVLFSSVFSSDFARRKTIWVLALNAEPVLFQHC